MGVMASQITSLTIVFSTVYSGADQRKHQSSALLVFVRGIHRGPVNSLHKGPVTRKMFSFDEVIMIVTPHGCHWLMASQITWTVCLTACPGISKENINALHYLHFMRGIHGWWVADDDWWITREQFHVMTSSWYIKRNLLEYIWVKSRNCGCLVTWFCYQLIAKPGNKTAAVPWPDPYVYNATSSFTVSHKKPTDIYCYLSSSKSYLIWCTAHTLLLRDTSQHLGLR